jgi:hypothetical protein
MAARGEAGLAFVPCGARSWEEEKRREGLFYGENKCSGGMSKYLYMMAANIDDVAPRQ